MEEKRTPYWGSTRFFKNLILLIVVAAIAVPTGFAIHYSRQQKALLAQMKELQQQVDELRQKTTEPDPQPVDQPDPLITGLDYQSLYPEFYAPQKLSITSKPEKTIFLTFDDGPSDRTDEVLEILARQGVKATFFVVGQTNPANQERMRKIVAQGHTIGMHSATHDYQKIYASVEAFLADEYEVFQQIRELTGVTPSVFRFPGGSINSYNPSLYQALIAEMLRRGFVPYDWNLAMGDALNVTYTAEEMVNNVIDAAPYRQYGVVLMHDSAAKRSTVAALEPMIIRLKEMGFQFSSLTPDVAPVMFAYKE